MLIEFDTVRSSSQEAHERMLLEETSGMASVPYFREQDYKTQITIDMDKVVDFTGGRVDFNDTTYECVYVYDKHGTMSCNLLISYQDFKTAFQNATGKKIYRFEEI